jgi:hypothetical protein
MEPARPTDIDLVSATIGPKNTQHKELFASNRGVRNECELVAGPLLKREQYVGYQVVGRRVVRIVAIDL